MVLLLLTLVLLAALVPQSYDSVVFLDVGQGDAILLQDGAQQVLIDGGEGMVVLSRLAEEMPWFDRTIELIILTHPQQDHMEGLLHVLERYEVGMVLMPYASHTSAFQETWLQQIIDQGIPYRFAWAGQMIRVGDIRLSILGPLDMPEAAKATQKDVNNASVITRVDFHGASFLLTGDAEKDAEALLIQHIPPEKLDVDVLKAGHHGSKTSTTEQLVAAASPKAAVISVGDNKFGHPTDVVLDRLSDISLFRTDRDGSVRFLWFDDKWWFSGI